MAATLTDERFTGPEWIFERKYDGIRLLAFRKATPSGSCPAINYRKVILPLLAQSVVWR